MFDADRALLLVGGAVVVLALSSRLVKRHALTPALLALAFGVLVGRRGLGWIDPSTAAPRGELLEQLARLALALAVFDITLRTRVSDLRANAARLAVLLLVVMPGMWLLTALGAGMLLGLPLASALIVGAVLTPTDPAVAASLVTGVVPNRFLPRRVRMSLQLESAANDGLALPFVLFAVFLATLPRDAVAGVWAPRAAREVGVAVALGAVVGFVLHRATGIVAVDRLADEDWYPLAGAGTAVGVMGLAHLLGASGVLAAFVAGLVFTEGLPQSQREPIAVVHRSLAKVGLTVVLLAFGAVLPIERYWRELGAGGVVFALWVLVVRRLPVALPALLLTRTGRLSSAYIAWSGPLGVAAIYYLAFVERFRVPDYERLFLVGSLAVAASVVGHAVTSAAVVHRYRAATGREAPEGEELVVEGRLP